MTHTPGPWHYVENGSAFYSHWILCEAHPEVNDTIAEVSNRSGESEDNAKLIAAAPDGHKIIAGLFDRCNIPDEMLERGYGRQINITAHEIRAMREYLAKATGND